MVMWRRGEDRGSVTVEFVLVLPVLLIILFSLIDFGRLMHAKLAWARQRLTRYFDDHAAIARLSPDPGCEVALRFS